MSKLSIAQSFEPVEVDLFGHDFETTKVTRTATLKLAEVEKTINAAQESEDVEQVVQAFGDMLDILLKSSDAKRTKPSTLIKDRWKNDDLALADLIAFVEDLGRAARPT